MNFLNKSILKNKVVLFSVGLFLIMLPSLILVVGVNRFLNHENEMLQQGLSDKFRELTRELKKYENTELFLLKNLTNQYYSNPKFAESEFEYLAFCKEIHNCWKDDFQVAVIDDKNNIVYVTDNIKFNNETLKEVIPCLFDFEHFENNKIKLKSVFGNQITKVNLKNNLQKNGYKFIYTDNTGKTNPFIMFHYGKLRFCVWASNRLLESDKHIEFICKKFANTNKINVGIYNINDISNTIHLCNNGELEIEVKNKIFSDIDQTANAKTSNYWLCRQYLGQNVFVFTYHQRKFSDICLWLIPLILFILYAFVFGSVVRYFYNKIVLGVSSRISIKIKFAVIMVLVSSISLISFYFVCKEYENHKMNNIIVEAKAYMADKMLEIDGRYEAYLSEIATKVDSKIDIWSKSLTGRELCIEDARILNSEFNEFDMNRYYLIASQSACWIENSGCYKYSGSLDDITMIASEVINASDVIDFNQFKFINLIAKRICADINEVELSENIMQKMDILVETVSKSGFVDIVYNVLNNLERIKPWEFGNKNSMGFFKLIKLYDQLQSDYLFSCFWYNSILERQFAKKFMPLVNRNLHNMKFIYYNLHDEQQVENSKENIQLHKIASKASINADDNYDVLTIDKTPYLVTSYKSPLFKHLVFLALYPMSEIEIQFKNQTLLLWILLSLSIILVLFSIGLLSNCFLVPLKKLENKAISIENKKYDSLSISVSNDEFGLLNKAFDDAVEKMKELELAQLVQESMFPDSNFEQQEFKVFGKSQVMTVVGGDYFDIFPVKDNSFVALMGDVAGHGVGASVLMSMAKSAMLTGKDKYESPAAMLNYLHKMVLATKTDKQRKIMTFQYVYINSIDGNALYGNAGGCAPCLVRNMGKYVEELKMPGAVLGAFKKANYKEMPLNLDNGDALIFYSDGIVEAKNSKDEMLGYDALFDIFKQAYHADPEKYYENIYAKYLEYIKGLEPQDDMTIVIITRRSKKAKLWDNVTLQDLA